MLLAKHLAFLVLFFLSASYVSAYEADFERKENISEVGRGYYSDYEYQIYYRINNERIRRRLNMLVWDERLAQIARDYSHQMAVSNFFGHADPNGNMIQDRIDMAHIKNWYRVGENLFWVQRSDNFADLAIQKWMASASHRENILDKTWTLTGIGIWRAESGRYYVTQVFLSEPKGFARFIE